MMIVPVVLSTTVRVILPIRPDQARTYAFQSAIRDVGSALIGEGGNAVDRTSLNCDRICQYAQANAGPAIVRPQRLKLAFATAPLEASAARSHDQLRADRRAPILQETVARGRRLQEARSATSRPPLRPCSGTAGTSNPLGAWRSHGPSAT